MTLDPPLDRHAWAKKILLRHERGEALPAISLDYAREVLGLPPDREREPGDDDE